MALLGLGSDALYYLYVGVFGLAALAMVATIPRLRRIEHADTRRGLVALVVTSGGWAAAHVGFFVAPTVELKLASYTVGLVVGLSTVGAWLYVCSAYTGRSFHRSPFYRRLAVVVFLVLVAVKVTNPLHQAYFTTTAVATPFAHLSIQNGPLHWAAMGLSYALAFVGYFLLLELFTQVDQDAKPLAVLVSITALPVVFDIAGYSSAALIDITYEPLGVAVFAIGVAYVYLDEFEEIHFAAERDTPVIVLDADDRILDTNQRARDLFPTLEAAIGEPLSAVLPGVADRVESDTDLLELERGNGRRYFQVTEAPYGKATAGLGRAIVFTDMTERERYRRELERQNDRLERFAGILSHDMRNPLMVMQARFDRFRDHVPADASDDVAAMERALARMEALIDDVLALARHGQPIDETVTITLASMVDECWEMVETGDATLHREGDLRFRGDPERVKRLFENLFRNSVDHAGPNVRVTVGPLPDAAGFYVADDGPGVPPGERDAVFESGHSTQSDGTGFGLAIVAEVVDAHGWTITLTESETGGARFEVADVEGVA